MDDFWTWTARHAAALPLLVAAAWTQAAPAAQAPGAPRNDPADPHAAVPAMTYRSPLSDYRRLGDQPVGDWRSLNDRVRAVGGWRAYAREANAPDGSDKASPAAPPRDAAPARAATPASPAGHGSHSDTPKER